MELVRLNSPCMDLKVLLSLTCIVQSWRQCLFPIQQAALGLSPLWESLVWEGLAFYKTKAPRLLVCRAGLCRPHIAFVTLLLSGNEQKEISPVRFKVRNSRSSDSGSKFRLGGSSMTLVILQECKRTKKDVGY